MLHRLLFVAGMTVGVMTPLVWTAYMARPASHAARAPAIETAKTKPGMPKSTPAPASRIVTKEATKDVATMVATTDDITASISPAATKPTSVQPAVLVTQPKADAPPRPVGHAKLTRPRPKLASLAPPRRMVHETEGDDIPAVVNHFNGAHIIIVCAALTVNEQLRAGCP